MKEIQGSLPEGTETMANVVHTHTQLLLVINGTNLKTLPTNVTNDKRNLAVQQGKNITIFWKMEFYP